MKVGIICAFILICAACLGASCGGSSGGSVPLGPGGQPRLADAAPVPDGVEPALWRMLLAELDRSLAFAPNNEPARVTDLELSWLPDGQIEARWEYNNPGDYDLNGEVNAADLVPIGVHYGATTASDDWPAARVADGDRNGVVGISDITPIGAGFGNVVDAYYVLASELAGPPAVQYNPDGYQGDVVATIARSGAVVPPEGGLPVFTVRFAPHPVFAYYWVAPVDEDVTFAGYDDLGIGSVRRGIDTDRRGDWYMQYRDGGHSNRSALAGPQTNYIHWQVSVPGEALGPPVYDADGTVYVGGEDGLHAISMDGTRAWICATDGAVTGAAAVGPTGAVYFGCTDGQLRAVSPAGELIWSIAGDGPLTTGVAVADDGTVYSASGAGELLAVSPAGELRWRLPSEGLIIDTPSLGRDGAIYVTTETERIVAATPDGRLRWPAEQQNFEYVYTVRTRLSPVLASYPVYELPIEDYSDYELREVLLFTGAPGYYHGWLDMLPVGEVAPHYWELTTAWADFLLHDRIPLLPTIRDDFSLLIPDHEFALTAYSLDTSELWTFDYPFAVDQVQPVSIGSNGIIYLALHRRYNPDTALLVALDSAGGLLWQLEFDADSLSQPVIGPDETVYIASSAGVLYAIGSDVNNSAPQLPRGLEAHSSSSSKIALYWDAADGASGYEVFRDAQDEPVAQLDGLTLNYDDEGLEPGSIHTYWIRAVNHFGASGFSEPATASAALLPPQDFAVSDGLYSDRMVLSWSKSQNATGYEIFRDTKYSNLAPYATIGDVAEWHDTSVTDWDEHTYWIRAVNGLVSSSKSSDTGFLARGTGDPGAGDWRQYGHDAQHSFAASAVGPATPPPADSVLYDPYRFDSTFSTRGTVFGNLGCQYVDAYSGGIFALNPDGSLRWHVERGNFPVVLDDGAIAAADKEGLIIYDPNGTERATDPAVLCYALAWHPSGDLIISEYTAVTRYNPQSGEVWSYEFPAEDGSPAREYPVAVAADGTAYVAMTSRMAPPQSGQGSPNPGPSPQWLNKVIALSADGARLWEFSQYGGLGLPVVGQDSSLLVSSSIGLVYLLRPDGSLRWSFPLAGRLAIAPDGMVVICLYGGSLLKLDSADFSLVWEYQPPAETYLYGQPVIDAAGNIFVAHEYFLPENPYTDLAGVTAVSSAGDLLWRYDTPDRSAHGLSLAADGGLWFDVRTVVEHRTYMRRYSLGSQ